MRHKRLNRFQRQQKRRLRRRWWILSALGVVCLSVAAALPVMTGRTTPRWYQLQAAKLAVSRAQEAGAEAWAPEAMRQAQATLRVAMVEHRSQELRFLFLRDFTQSEDLLRDAQDKAVQALAEATLKQRDARNASQQSITRAAEAVGRGVEMAEAMHLGNYDRQLLQKSKLQLQEAELLQRSGKFDLATLRARSSQQQAELVASHTARAAARYADASLIRSWRGWIDDTVGWSRRSGAPAIVVLKDKHTLTLFDDGRPVRTYVAELGYNSLGDKWRAGDAATPEGRYRITAKKGPGQSAYHMALLLNYPNEEDVRSFEAAKRAGRLSRRASLGGLIEIHGEGGRGKDWTNGCVALANNDIQDLFKRVAVGTPVTIVGGDGNGGTFTKLVDMQRAGRRSEAN